MTVHDALVAWVVAARLLELAWSRRNTRRLLAAGAHEAAPRHYPLIVAVHVAWIAAVAFLIPRDAPVSPVMLGLFVALQAARVWVLWALGWRWTTRIVVLPGAPLVRRGPYRLLRHPNYLVVAGEIAALPLVFGAWAIALAFTVANGALLVWRIRAEERALGLRGRAEADPEAAALDRDAP